MKITGGKIPLEDNKKFLVAVKYHLRENYVLFKQQKTLVKGHYFFVQGPISH